MLAGTRLTSHTSIKPLLLSAPPSVNTIEIIANLFSLATGSPPRHTDFASVTILQFFRQSSTSGSLKKATYISRKKFIIPNAETHNANKSKAAALMNS
jgi:hypothetical protein